MMWSIIQGEGKNDKFARWTVMTVVVVYIGMDIYSVQGTEEGALHLLM